MLEVFERLNTSFFTGRTDVTVVWPCLAVWPDWTKLAHFFYFRPEQSDIGPSDYAYRLPRQFPNSCTLKKYCHNMMYKMHSLLLRCLLDYLQLLQINDEIHKMLKCNMHHCIMPSLTPVNKIGLACKQLQLFFFLTPDLFDQTYLAWTTFHMMIGLTRSDQLKNNSTIPSRLIQSWY